MIVRNTGEEETLEGPNLRILHKSYSNPGIILHIYWRNVVTAAIAHPVVSMQRGTEEPFDRFHNPHETSIIYNKP